MRSKLLFLVLIVVGILVIGSSVQAQDNVIVNPGFEEPLNPATNWEAWGWGGHWAAVGSDPAIALSGNYLECAGTHQNGGSGAFQMFDAEEGEFYAISAWAKTVTPNSRATLILIVFDDLTVGGTESTELYREELDMTGRDWDGGTWHALPDWTYGELEIQLLEENFTRADPTIHGQLEIKIEVANNGGDGISYFDNVSGYLGGLPDKLVANPNPPDGATGVSPSTTILSWERLVECPDANSLVELWWGIEDDPNFWTAGPPVKIMDLTNTDSFDLSDPCAYSPSYAGPKPITLEPETHYYWALKYQDPNGAGCNWGIEELAEGPAWHFDTINGPPNVDAGDNLSRWMAAGDPPLKIGLDSTTTDDGLPDGCYLTYKWTADPCSTVTFTPTNTCQDPNIIVTLAGEYTLTLTVDDGKLCNPSEYKESSDSILVRVFSNSDDRLKAHWPLNDISVDANDIAGGHDGTIVGDPVQASGQVDEAIELDGDDYITIPDTGTDPNVVIVTGGTHSWENQIEDGITVSAWMNLANGWSKDYETLVGKSLHGWELQREGGGDNVRFVVRGQGDESKFNSGDTSAVSDAALFDVTSGWHQLVGTFDGNRVVIYIDGLPAGTADTSFEKIAMDPSEITIGTTSGIGTEGSDGTPWDEDRSIWSATGNTFVGKIDQVKIFDAPVPWRAEHSNTPGIVEMFRADGGHGSCGGVYLVGDQNEDCYITLADFAIVAFDWLECSDAANADCD